MKPLGDSAPAIIAMPNAMAAANFVVLIKARIAAPLPATAADAAERHRIENLFARLKAFRRIATRYEKLRSSFAAMLSLACILVWLKL